MCAAPPAAALGELHVTASNDGALFSAPALARGQGAGSYLVYRVADARPWGQWLLANDTFPAAGNSSLAVQLRGLVVDGAPDGGVFLNTGLVSRQPSPGSA